MTSTYTRLNYNISIKHFIKQHVRIKLKPYQYILNQNAKLMFRVNDTTLLDSYPQDNPPKTIPPAQLSPEQLAYGLLSPKTIIPE